MKLLHLAIDDKFTNSAHQNFNKLKNIENQWAIIKRDKFTYLEEGQFIRIKPHEIFFPLFKKYLKKFDFIIIHSLTPNHCKVINIVKHRYIWVGMGFDYYDFIEGESYLSFSKKFLKNQTPTFRNKSKETFKYLIIQLLETLHLNFNNKINAIKSITFFSPVLYSEYLILKDIFNNLQYLNFSYGASASIISKEIRIKDSANSILVGNSADPSNNHFEILELLSKLKLDLDEVILPLSYGSTQYRGHLLESINSLSNLKVKAIKDFTNKDVYFNLLSNCNIAIMNHVRQQALGNINVMLAMGAKVFLNEQSPLCEFYKSKGAIIYTISDLKATPSLLIGSLDKESKKINRAIVLSEFSQSSIDKKLNAFIQTLQSSE